MKASPPPANGLEERLPDLERAVRALTREQIEAFAVVVRAGRSVYGAWPSDDRFWFTGTAGASFSRSERGVIRALWTGMNAALVAVITGREIADSIEHPGGVARLIRSGPLSRKVEGQAAAILEREMGGDIWLAATGIWNGLCAALVGDRLEPPVRESLEAPWIGVVGSRLS